MFSEVKACWQPAIYVHWLWIDAPIIWIRSDNCLIFRYVYENTHTFEALLHHYLINETKLMSSKLSTAAARPKQKEFSDYMVGTGNDVLLVPTFGISVHWLNLIRIAILRQIITSLTFAPVGQEIAFLSGEQKGHYRVQRIQKRVRMHCEHRNESQDGDFRTRWAAILF